MIVIYSFGGYNPKNNYCSNTNSNCRRLLFHLKKCWELTSKYWQLQTDTHRGKEIYLSIVPTGSRLGIHNKSITILYSTSVDL